MEDLSKQLWWRNLACPSPPSWLTLCQEKRMNVEKLIAILADLEIQRDNLVTEPALEAWSTEHNASLAKRKEERMDET